MSGYKPVENFELTLPKYLKNDIDALRGEPLYA